MENLNINDFIKKLEIKRGINKDPEKLIFTMYEWMDHTKLSVATFKRWVKSGKLKRYSKGRYYCNDSNEGNILSLQNHELVHKIQTIKKLLADIDAILN